MHNDNENYSKTKLIDESLEQWLAICQGNCDKPQNKPLVTFSHS